MLINKGHSIADFPVVVNNYDASFDERNINFSNIVNDQYIQLNRDQKEIIDIILQVSNNIGYNGFKRFYIDGPGGSGKTFVYRALYNLLKSQKKKICCMTFTGITATLLPNGKTVHKVLGLHVPLLSDSSSNFSVRSKEGQFLRQIDVFVWDEAPMAPRYALEIMDRILRDVMNNDLLFGRKIVILGGDFRELLPVLPRGIRSEIVNLSIKNSFLWNNFHKFKLTRNMRAVDDDMSFAQFVFDVGNGTLNDDNDNIIIPERCIIRNNNFVDCVYGEFIRNRLFEEMSSLAILSARNVDVNELNKEVVSLLDSYNIHKH